MIDNFCIVVNTFSSYSDIWEMFFKQLEKHFPNQKVYVFSDEDNKLFEKYNVVIYDKDLDFRTQYYECLKSVGEKYCLNMNDDYIMYYDVNVGVIHKLLDYLEKNLDISFIRVAKGYNNTEKMADKDLYFLDLNFPFFYSQTVSIWRTETLLKIHELSPKSSIARKDNLPQLEVVANEICKSLKLNGLYHYDKEPKRGSSHYDSYIFPYIASALVSGKWNFSEYNKELLPLIEKYNINVNLRGIF